MLLRSASTPLLNSLVHASSPRESSPIEAESVHQIQRPRSLMLSSSSSCCCYSPMSVHSSDESARRMKRTASESDLRHLTSTKPSKFLSGGGGALMEDVEEGIGFGLIRTSSYDGLSWSLEEDGTEVSGGCGGGGRVIHGGGNGDGSDGEDGGDDSTDVHYRKMIEANPGNGIFLSNYAKFLKEVRLLSRSESDL